MIQNVIMNLVPVYLNPKVPDEFVMHTVNGGGDPRYTPDPNRPNQTMQLKRPGADIIRTPTTPCKQFINYCEFFLIIFVKFILDWLHGVWWLQNTRTLLENTLMFRLWKGIVWRCLMIVNQIGGVFGIYARVKKVSFHGILSLLRNPSKAKS